MNIVRSICRNTLVLGLAGGLAVVAVACGGADNSQFANGSGNGDGTGVSGGSSDNPTVNLGNPGGGVNQACAESTAKAQLVPVYLVFMVDRSGSMSQNSKWDTITKGLESFFSDPKSAGLNASIAFFKNDQNECDPSAYATPAVAMTALPTAAFQASIAGYSPNGGTPTLPAVKGAIQYAQTQVPAHPGAKVAVVLATDGMPNDCNSTVPDVAAASATVASTIPTFVIGVGPEAANLDALAVGGGTQKAFIVSVGDPAKTASDFQTALDSIRGKTLSCDFQLPAPPQGKQLDINKVNVVFTPAGGAAQTLTYNKDCTGGAGWHYDDPATPAQIVLCPSTCSTVQAQQGAAIDIVTGCQTSGGVQR